MFANLTIYKWCNLYGAVTIEMNNFMNSITVIKVGMERAWVGQREPSRV